MNKGISLATGQLIGIINSDDWYELDAVEEIVRAYKDGSTIIYGFMRHIVEEKPIEVYAAYPVSIPCKMIPHSTCFVPKFIYDQYGTFDLSYRSCADYHFILRLYKEGISFSILEKSKTPFISSSKSSDATNILLQYFSCFEESVPFLSKYMYPIIAFSGVLSS